MNTPIDPQDQENRPQINEQRRRLAKAGLAAPVVMGTLLSRPVLGAEHNCTISGQLSGNVSTHLQGNCTLLGKSPATWAATNISFWPADFKDNSNKPLLFKNTPSSLVTKFADAFAGPGGVGDATVLEVLNGDATLRGNPHKATLALGKEVVAAAMNALDGTNGYPAFPITAADAVEMFNDLDSAANLYVTSDFGGVSWTETQVIDYLNNLYV